MKDDVFIQICSNVFDINIILIPLSPSSAHHAGMYLDVRSISGGSGDPIFMLYFEEWRTAGHYQSLEPDPKILYNLVLAHFEWRSRNLTTSRIVPDSSTSASLPSNTGSESPVTPHAAGYVTRVPPQPDTCVADQLYSTRQRLESDGGASFSQIISPITAQEPQSNYNDSQSGNKM